MNPHEITYAFERRVAEYTGAPFACAVDNCSNALFLALWWWKKRVKSYANSEFDRRINLPSRTYPSVPCEVLHAGFEINFVKYPGETIKGEYRLSPSIVWDSALRFTSGMYRPGQIQCLSFTGSKKHLKLGKGGMILTDDEAAYKWFKKARFSGRGECSYHEDDFDSEPSVAGWNFYMLPEIAARGLLLMQEFPMHNEDLELPYPDLSRFKCYQ